MAKIGDFKKKGDCPLNGEVTVPYMGRAVVCLVSDRTMLDVTSWIPGSCESFSKKNCS
jgi:hypothetical protein